MLLTLTGCTIKSTTPKKAKSSVKTVKVDKQQSKEKQAKYQVIDQIWRIQQDRVDIYGHIYLPQGLAGKKKAVILAHGLAGNYRDLTSYAKYLASRGYVAYTFDFPGGAKNGQSSGVDQLKMSIFTEEKNLQLVLNTIKNRTDVDRKQVSLLGESQGGAVAAMLASKYPQEVKSLILLYPAFSITDYAQAAFKSEKQVPDKLNLFGFTIGKAYFENLFKYNLLKEATKYHGPVLIMHGTSDMIIPDSYSIKANKKFKHSKLYLFKGAGHDFKGKYHSRADTLIDKFLQKNGK